MGLLTTNGATLNVVLQIAGVPVVYYSHVAPTVADGMFPLDADGVDTYAVQGITRASPVEWRVPELGGFAEYRPVEIEIATDGPNGTHAWAPDRLFGRYDGGAWSARLTQTLSADEDATLYVNAAHPGPFPCPIYVGQETIVIDGSTSEGGGEWSLDIVARGAGETPPQLHSVQTGDAVVYLTSHPTYWANRGVSIWNGLIDPDGNLIGDYVEVFAGEIEGQVKIRPASVHLQIKPLLAALKRLTGQREPESFELARGVHRYQRGVVDALQIMVDMDQNLGAAERVVRGITAEILTEGVDVETVGWPGGVLRRINSALEAGRSDVDPPDPDAEESGAHAQTHIGVEQVSVLVSGDGVSSTVRVAFTGHPLYFTNGRDEAPPTVGDDIISPERLIYWGVDCNRLDSPRYDNLFRPRRGWASETGVRNTATPADYRWPTRPWPIEAYSLPEEGGLLLSDAPDVPAEGIWMVAYWVDVDTPPGEGGERVEHAKAFLATAVEDLGDGTFWLTVDPATPLPPLGQRDEATRARFVRATVARDYPFWEFVLQVMGSGTATGALGEYDVHVDGAGVLGFRLNADSFRRIRLPATFGNVRNAAALRDPTTLVRSILRMALVCIGIDTGPDNRARLTAFRREGARPDLARLTLNASNLAPADGSGGVEVSIVPQRANSINIKLANEDGETREVSVVNNHGLNAANRQNFHLAEVDEREDGEVGLDLDLSAIDVGFDPGTIATSVTPLSSRIFALTNNGRRRFVVSVDGARVNVSALRPFDVVSLTTPAVQSADGTWGIESHTCRIVGVSFPQLEGRPIIILEDAGDSEIAVGWNACGLITARTATTITIDESEYVDAQSIVDGSPQVGIDQFSEGDAVRVASWGDWSNAVATTITDITGNVMTLADAPPAMAGPDWGIVWPDNYANMSTEHRQLLVMGDADGVVTTGVDAGTIT